MPANNPIKARKTLRLKVNLKIKLDGLANQEIHLAKAGTITRRPKVRNSASKSSYQPAKSMLELQRIHLHHEDARHAVQHLNPPASALFGWHPSQ